MVSEGPDPPVGYRPSSKGDGHLPTKETTCPPHVAMKDALKGGDRGVRFLVEISISILGSAPSAIRYQPLWSAQRTKAQNPMRVFPRTIGPLRPRAANGPLRC